jgi:hypothetical protein
VAQLAQIVLLEYVLSRVLARSEIDQYAGTHITGLPPLSFFVRTGQDYRFPGLVISCRYHLWDRQFGSMKALTKDKTQSL